MEELKQKLEEIIEHAAYLKEDGVISHIDHNGRAAIRGIAELLNDMSDDYYEIEQEAIEVEKDDEFRRQLDTMEQQASIK